MKKGGKVRGEEKARREREKEKGKKAVKRREKKRLGEGKVRQWNGRCQERKNF